MNLCEAGGVSASGSMFQQLSTGLDVSEGVIFSQMMFGEDLMFGAAVLVSARGGIFYGAEEEDGGGFDILWS